MHKFVKLKLSSYTGTEARFSAQDAGLSVRRKEKQVVWF